MAEDAGGAGGYEVGSAYVTVSPDAEAFPGQLEEQLGGIDYVVSIPVRADTAGLQESVDAAAAEAQATVVVPVAADPAGLKESVDAAAASSGASVTVPLVADPADLAGQADAAATAAGEEAGAGFAEKFSSVASSTALFVPDEGEITAAASAAGSDAGASFGENLVRVGSGFPLFAPSAAAEASAEASAAGAEAGAGFSEAFSAAAAGITEPLAALGPAAEAEGVAAGEEAGAGFVSRLGAMLSGVTSMFTGLIPAAATEGAEAGTAAGEGFASRFAAMMSGVTGALSGLIPGMEAEGAAGGTAAGEGFVTRLKGIITGSISPMEALMGAGFIAAAAMMATHFDSAMEMIHTQAGVAQGAIAGLSGQVLNLAGKVGVGPDSLSDALYHVESAFQSSGITGQRAMQMVQIAAEGARTGSANLVDVQNALDAAVVAGIPGVNNLSQAMGALNAIVGSGDMHMQDLADAMGTGAVAQAKLYGQSLTEVGAALAVFGDNNIRGAKAATDLRMTWQAIQAPLKSGDAMLQQIGLTSTSLADTMTHHGLTAAIGEFIAHLEASKVPVGDWGQYVTDIFGKRAGTGIGVLVEQYTRLQQKLSDITSQSHTFGSAWAATQQTTAQKVHELEASFQSLMIRIGNGLLPVINSLLDAINQHLPQIEAFGERIAHLAAPVVTTFFTGLEAILKFLLGPMRDVTIAVGVMAAAWMALNVIMNLDPFVAIGTAIILLTGLIVKYHKQIWDAIKSTWDKVAAFFTGLYDKIVRPVEKIFDDIKKAITSGFDAWWKSHGKELEEVWSKAWEVIKTVVTVAWDFISGYLKAGWDALTGVFQAAFALLTALFKTAWDAIVLVVKTAWDAIAAVVKVELAAIETAIKVAWDLIVGIFSVFLDLITGHWSRAFSDMQATATQIWNAIKGFLGSVWHAIYDLIVQVVNNLKGFLTGAWHAIEQGVTAAFEAVLHTVTQIWDDIVNVVRTAVNTIKGLISDITGPVGSAVSSALGAIGIHLARGGVIPGYAPGHDTVNAKLSPGEAVLVPEAVRAIGPGRINAINAHYSAGRGGGYSLGGVVPDPYGGTFPAGHTRGGDGYAYGGIFPYGGQQPYQPEGSAAGPGGGVNNFFLTFAGTKPTNEEFAAIEIKLAAAVGAAG